MEEYLTQRQELIANDRASRPDQSYVNTLSSEERKADQILHNIRIHEMKTIWDGERPAKHQHGPQHMFPGMGFLTARETIISTELYKILSRMPKGGLLHAHLDATVRADILLRFAIQQPAVHVRVSEALTSATLRSVSPQFRPLPRSEWTSLSSLTDQQYSSNSWVSIQNARNNFSPEMGGPEGFDRWVIDALMINPSEAYGTHDTTTKIWQKFQATFAVSSGLIRFAPVFSQYIKEFLLSSIADGISYVEPRINFWYKNMFNEDGEENIPHRVWVQMFDRVVNEVKGELKAQDREDEFVGAKIIYSTIRNVSCSDLEFYLEDCLALKQEFPHLIAGFDLVGHEDKLRPLIDYAEPLLKFRERQKELGVHIPFIFHAGETTGDGSSADVNLYDAILLGTKRIGHGFSLYKHPKLMELCRDKGICVEMCPISNEILRLTGSMPMHPLPAIINHGVHVTLCSDDPAVFGNMGLSFDFFQVFVASEVNTLATLRAFVWDSIKFSSLDDQEKERAYAALERSWTKFIKYILDNYSDRFGTAASVSQ